jgi:cytochrome c553
MTHEDTMTYPQRLTAPTLALLLFGMAAGAPAADAGKGAEIATNVCAACHGADGNSPVPTFPNLAGQQPSYLTKELQDYKSGKRASEVMAPFAASLSDADIANLAAHFSTQKPAPGTVTRPELLTRGKKLYFEGNPDSGVPSCDSCHEANGAGANNGGFPRIASQHVDYTLEQFKLYAGNKRMNGKRVMRTIASRLSEEETLALAEYLASMP